MELHASFNTFDYIILGIILFSGLLAVFSGFVREMYSLFNLAASYFIAMHFYGLAEPFVKHYISNHNTVTVVSMVVTFCVSFVILAVIGMIVTRLLVRGGALTLVDRSLGLVFGLIRGLLIVSLLYLAATTFLWPDIEKDVVAEAAQQEMPRHVEEKSKTEGKSITISAPHWLMHARTRPMLAHGANLLKSFIPEKALDKTTEEVLDKKAEVEHKVKEEIQNSINDIDKARP